MKGFIVAAFFFFASTAGAYTFDVNVPADIQAQILKDLDFIDQIQGKPASPLHQKIFGNVRGADYTRFFSSRIKTIGMGCTGVNVVACVVPHFSSSKMYLTTNFTQFSHPQIARLMVLFHEARHTETLKGNWNHARCPAIFKDNGRDLTSIWTGAALAGELACDITPYGSYGVSVIMLKNISKNCTNCTAKVKMDADLYGNDQFKRIVSQTGRMTLKTDLYDQPAYFRSLTMWPEVLW